MECDQCIYGLHQQLGGIAEAVYCGNESAGISADTLSWCCGLWREESGIPGIVLLSAGDRGTADQLCEDRQY